MSLILIIEDKLSVAEVIADALTPLRHNVSVAVTAGDALAIVAMDRPDVILLDVNLPDASGTSTLDRLRQVRPDVPVIIVTGNADEELARATLKRGAFDYVMKPFNIDHLIRMVDAALASR
jgi:two-component system, NtrC family, response regulator AtoC